MSGDTPKRFVCGLNNSEVAAELRAMADEIERGEVITTSITDSTRRSTEDFEVKHLVIRYHQKRKQDG